LSQFQAQLRPSIRAKRRGRLFDHGPFVVTETFPGVSSVVMRGNINCAARTVLAAVSQDLLQSVNLISASNSSKTEPASLLALKTSAATADWSDRLPNVLYFFLNK